MTLWNPVSIADTRLGSEEQHQCTTGSSAFSNYWVESRSVPQYYNCNFCEREFRSAQALGGHMNVHRRDRALLRLTSSNSTSPSTILPPDSTPLLGKGVTYCLPQQPHSHLPTSPHKDRSIAPSPFFYFFDSSSPILGWHCQTPYSKEADLYRFRSDAVYSNPFGFSNEKPPSPSPSLAMSVVGSAGTVHLQKKMRWEADPSQDGTSNVGLDLELRLGNTSSSSSRPP